MHRMAKPRAKNLDPWTNPYAGHFGYNELERFEKWRKRDSRGRMFITYNHDSFVLIAVESVQLDASLQRRSCSCRRCPAKRPGGE